MMSVKRLELLAVTMVGMLLLAGCGETSGPPANTETSMSTATPKPPSTGDWEFVLQTDPISDAVILAAMIEGGQDSLGLENHGLIIKCYSQGFPGAMPVGNELNIYWGYDITIEAIYLGDVRHNQLPAVTDTMWVGYPGAENLTAFIALADGTEINAREYAAAHMVGTDTFTVRLNEWFFSDPDSSERIVGMVATFDITGIEGVLSRLDQECPN